MGKVEWPDGLLSYLTIFVVFRYKAKKRFKHSDYRKVRSTEMTQTVGSPFEEDEFDAALDYADDVNG